MGRLSGKSALITGGARGIGYATAKRFIEEGANVLITDLLSEIGAKAAIELGEKAHFIFHDVSSKADWDAVITEAIKLFGSVDIVVNNAGIIGTTDGKQNIENTSLEELHGINSVNLDGVYLGCQAAVEAMKSKGGAIVNVSSLAAKVATPTLIAYGASKAAVCQLTKSIAIHCGRR